MLARRRPGGERERESRCCWTAQARMDSSLVGGRCDHLFERGRGRKLNREQSFGKIDFVICFLYIVPEQEGNYFDTKNGGNKKILF